MTPEERDLLTRYLADLDRARADDKDREAADLIARAMASNPDAGYLLVQNAILTDQALIAARAHIDDLEERLRREPEQPTQGGGGSFLGGLFGGDRRPDPDYRQPDYRQPDYRQGDYRQPEPQRGPWGQPTQTMVPQTQQGGFFGGGQQGQPGGGGSFLRTAAAGAAGVAGGALLFQGLSGLMGGHQGGGLFGGGGQGLFGGDQTDRGLDEGARQSFADNSGLDAADDRVSYDSDNGDFGGDDYSCSGGGGRLPTPEGALDVYGWADRSIDFHRCRTCGCVTHWSSVDPARDRMRVSARLLHPDVLARAPVRRLDGAATGTYLD